MRFRSESSFEEIIRVQGGPYFNPTLENLRKSVRIKKSLHILLMPAATIESTDTDLHQPTILTCDVAIVGGGIVGHTFALGLQQAGLQVILIEAQAESIAVAKGRAYALSILSGRIFQSLGIWSEVLPHFSQFSQIQISDADSPAIVHLLPENLGTTALGYAAGHGVLLNALQAKLKSTNFSYLCPAQVDRVSYEADRCELAITTPTGAVLIHSTLTVGADGAKSPLRQQAEINTKGWAYWQSCVTATIIPTNPHQNIAYERFWADGPLGVLPLADGRVQIVWTAPHQHAQELVSMPIEEFLDRLQLATGNILGKLKIDSQRFLFPVQLMQSDQYIKHRLALVGDAAHCCHPVAGQGMNLGIRDAAALAEILVAAHQQGEDLGSAQVLQRYQNWRQPENWAILAFTDFLDRFFSTDLWPVVMTRRIGLRLLENIPVVKHLSLRLMTGLAGRIPKVAQTTVAQTKNSL
jgi:2-octaprenyl-6-methoxyphenol hydroxylase